MSTVRIPRQQRFVLDNVSWNRYTRLLHTFSDRHLRITYDRGVLEIMTLSFEHETLSGFLGLLVITLTQELNLPLRLGRSTTLRRRHKQRGLEPDDCCWITHEPEVRGKTRINLRTDPPPDLAIEVDISRSSLNRMGIYAKLRVPEVWRYDSQGLAFCTLNANGDYDAAPVSAIFAAARITAADLMPFIQMRGQMDDNAIIRQFRAWLHTRITPTPTP
jgi:Uma2 family endonuclease